MLEISPDKIAYFEKNESIKSFYLLISSKAKDEFVLKETKHYKTCKVITYHPNESIQEIVDKKITKHADIFFLNYKNPDYFKMTELTIDPTQRFLEMLDRDTTPVDPKVIRYFLDVIYNTKPRIFVKKINAFFNKLGNATSIHYIDKEYKTEAIVKMSPDCLWSEISGIVLPGETSVIPAGELALSHDDFDSQSIKKLDINGEITLHGYPILQLASFNKENKKYFIKKQKKLFAKLIKLENHPVIASIEDGIITKLKGCDDKSKDPIAALEELFNIDKQYRIIFELGIGLNPNLKLLPGNCNMNETYGGEGSCVHFGVGSIFADNAFHLDIICPSTKILAGNKTILKHNKKISLNRVSRNQCICEGKN